MAKNAVIVGLALIALGVIITIASDSESLTSMIPAFIGALFVILGIVGLSKPELNHHVMHGAAALALLAILGSVGSMIGRDAGGWALVSQLITITVAGGFLFMAIQSFKAARLAREAEGA